ncbi:MAG: hypothetical protein KGJ79_12005 [Alphaproteobacteria bacterium]|nr:hypothetical protein [Alphaproteobacteria bacterium]MDE2111858.1 hypothetical protein [Alphaproteobacteria bacterium]MDE2493598.1 hypothetical protein [Alphaproteobacteria bacterium]
MIEETMMRSSFCPQNERQVVVEPIEEKVYALPEAVICVRRTPDIENGGPCVGAGRSMACSSIVK